MIGILGGQTGEMAGVVASERVRRSCLWLAVCSLGSKPTAQQLRWGEEGGEDSQSSLVGPWEVVRL